jgi:predicted ABC-type ATPase
LSKTPRIRIFAGPNGSGKSTLNRKVAKHILGIVINPDDIERNIRNTGYFDFDAFKIARHKEAAVPFLLTHPVVQKSPTSIEHLNHLVLENDRLKFPKTEIDSYIASALSDFIRRSLIKEGADFTFESVMSSPDKVALLKEAKDAGYRVYVYYVATVDPEINVARVAYRVTQGGHDVPADKVRDRYTKSLGLLADAILLSNRAYI